VFRALQIVPLAAEPLGGAPSPELLDWLVSALAKSFGVPVRVRPKPFDIGFAADPDRNQYYSSAILARLAGTVENPGEVVLGVTALDLFVPVLTFVFGEAQLHGACALVSIHRLENQFYGLPSESRDLTARLLKEALHEIGHTQGLKHCHDWRCVMASAHAVERLDIKEAGYCAQCAGLIR
jgi:archaemetzincin